MFKDSPTSNPPQTDTSPPLRVRGRHATEEERQIVHTLTQAGKSIRYIADETGLGRSTVHKIQREPVKPRRKREDWNPPIDKVDRLRLVKAATSPENVTKSWQEMASDIGIKESKKKIREALQMEGVRHMKKVPTLSPASPEDLAVGESCPAPVDSSSSASASHKSPQSQDDGDDVSSLRPSSPPLVETFSRPIHVMHKRIHSRRDIDPSLQSPIPPSPLPLVAILSEQQKPTDCEDAAFYNKCPV